MSAGGAMAGEGQEFSLQAEGRRANGLLVPEDLEWGAIVTPRSASGLA